MPRGQTFNRVSMLAASLHLRIQPYVRDPRTPLHSRARARCRVLIRAANFHGIYA